MLNYFKYDALNYFWEYYYQLQTKLWIQDLRRSSNYDKFDSGIITIFEFRENSYEKYEEAKFKK